MFYFPAFLLLSSILFTLFLWGSISAVLHISFSLNNHGKVLQALTRIPPHHIQHFYSLYQNVFSGWGQWLSKGELFSSPPLFFLSWFGQVKRDVKPRKEKASKCFMLFHHREERGLLYCWRLTCSPSHSMCVYLMCGMCACIHSPCNNKLETSGMLTCTWTDVSAHIWAEHGVLCTD